DVPECARVLDQGPSTCDQPNLVVRDPSERASWQLTEPDLVLALEGIPDRVAIGSGHRCPEDSVGVVARPFSILGERRRVDRVEKSARSVHRELIDEGSRLPWHKMSEKHRCRSAVANRLDDRPPVD